MKLPTGGRYFSLYLVGFYVAISALWILTSDRIALYLAKGDAGRLQHIQNEKGLFFVVGTGVLLYLFSEAMSSRLRQSLQHKQRILKKYRALNEITNEAIIDYDIRRDQAYVNVRMRSLLGAQARLVDNFRTLHTSHIHPDDRQAVLDSWQDFLHSERRLWKSTYRYHDVKSGWRQMVSRGFVTRAAGTGEPLRMMYALQDLTDFQGAESKRLQLEMNYRTDLADAVLRAQEKERNRWAEELHDDVCQTLTVCKLQLEHHQLESPSPLLQRTTSLIVTALNRIRHLSASLKPPSFESATLQQSIEDLMANVERVLPLETNLRIDPELDALLDEGRKLLLYRVVQEQVSNILKYAQATEVSIEVLATDDVVELCVHDNGAGVRNGSAKAGIGLKNIRGRLGLYGGRMEITSAPGAGFTLLAQLPYPAGERLAEKSA